MGVASLVYDERRQERGGAGEPQDRLRGSPADQGRPDECEHEQRHSAGSQQRPLEVKLAAGCALVLVGGQQSERGQQRQRHDREVDKQHPTPSGTLGKQAPDGDADGGSDRRDASPDAQRRVAIFALRERRRENRERGGGHDRGANTLRDARADQQTLAVRDATGQRADREPNQSGDENPPAAQQVRCTTAKQQEAPVGEEVAAGDPLQVLLGEVQVVLNRWQRDVDDRRVGHVHELNPA